MTTLPVYYDPTIIDCQIGLTHILTGAEAHHAANVRRTAVGECIDVVDGDGVRATLKVTRVDRDTVVGDVIARSIDPAPVPHITLVQALAKGGRDEQAIETATEYGVDAVIPWAAERSVVKWHDANKIERGIERWQNTCIAASKQSRRSRIPEVHDVCDSRELANRIDELTGRGTQVFVCHENASEEFSHITISSPEVFLVVGPEGGITDEELNHFVAAGARAVRLSDTVLRSATAGPWAIAVMRSRAGELSKH